MKAETHTLSSIGKLQISEAVYEKDGAVAIRSAAFSTSNRDAAIATDATKAGAVDAEEEMPPPLLAVVSSASSSQEDLNDINAFSSSSSDDKNTKQLHRNINSYYDGDQKVGFYQTLSLILNAGLMLYAHLGLSAVIYSSRDPNITAVNNYNRRTAETEGGGTCNEQDTQNWIQNGGEATRPIQSNYCSRTYTSSIGTNNNNICLTSASCISECFQLTYNYSAECSQCFAGLITCSVKNMCSFVCAADSFSDGCKECNLPCVDEFMICSGFPEVDSAVVTEEVVAGVVGEGEGMQNVSAIETNMGNGTTSITSIKQQSNEDTCNRYDLSEINSWYNAYELTFVRSMKDAWHGDAKILAVIIVLFSMIWPYTKSIILVIVWYTPMSRKRQSDIILWLCRLSKFTLVDVFAVVGVLVGVQLQLNVGGTDAVIRAEPRFGIIAFFLATLWQFLQVELIKVMYEQKVVGRTGRFNDEGGEEREGRLLFKQLWIPILIYIVSVALFISGVVTELISFENSDIGSEGVCVRSFNLATLGNALVSPSSLTDNSATGQTWILYLIYVILVLAFPVLTHSLQAIFLLGWSRSMKLNRMIKWTSAIWYFACVDVLLIGVFAMEFKFPQLIMKLAGENNKGFLDIESGLGRGFFLLIVYSISAGFLQFCLIVRDDDEGTSEEKTSMQVSSMAVEEDTV